MLPCGVALQQVLHIFDKMQMARCAVHAYPFVVNMVQVCCCVFTTRSSAAAAACACMPTMGPPRVHTMLMLLLHLVQVCRSACYLARADQRQ